MTDIRRSGYIVKMNPLSVFTLNNALGTQDNAIFVAVVQCFQRMQNPVIG